MELVFFCCDFGRKLEGLRLLLKNQDFLPSDDGKKRGVFSLLQRRIAPRSVRLDACSCRSLSPSYFLESGTAEKDQFQNLVSCPEKSNRQQIDAVRYQSYPQYCVQQHFSRLNQKRKIKTKTNLRRDP